MRKSKPKINHQYFFLSFRKGWETSTTVQLNGAIQMRRVKWVYVKIKQNILTNRIARPEGCYLSWCDVWCALLLMLLLRWKRGIYITSANTHTNVLIRFIYTMRCYASIRESIKYTQSTRSGLPDSPYDKNAHASNDNCKCDEIFAFFSLFCLLRMYSELLLCR